MSTELAARDARERRGGLRTAVTVEPKKALGQHFLVDENILGVIGRMSDLARDRRRARGRARARRPHALPRRPRARSSTRSSSTGRSSRRSRRARRTTERRARSGRTRCGSISEALRPSPSKLVANLPYNIATPLVVETLEHAASLERWCVMVQREVADRFFAVPRTKAYGAVSVLVQLAARKVGFHAVPPTVFRPRPRVESALVAFERAPIAAIARRPARRRGGVRAPTEDGSRTHWRRRVSLSRPGEEALAAIGHPANARAEELAPPEFVRARRGVAVSTAQAYAKINLALVVGPLRPDGKHEVVTVLQRVDLHDTITVEPRGRARRRRVRRGHDRARRARGARARQPEASPAGACASRSGSRSRPASAAGSSDAATALTLANALARAAAGARRAPRARSAARCRRPVLPRPRSPARDGRRDGARARRPSDRVLGRPRRSRRRDEGVDRRGLRRFRRSSWRRRIRGAGAREWSTRCPRSTGVRDLAALPRNDLASSPLARELEAAGRLSGGRVRRGPDHLRALRAARGGTAARLSLPRGRGCDVRRASGRGERSRVSGKMAQLLGRGQVVRQRVLVP